KSSKTSASGISNQLGQETRLNSPQPRDSASKAKPTAPAGAARRVTKVSSADTPRLLGQRRERGGDRLRLAPTHSQSDISTRRAEKQLRRMIPSLRNS